MKKAFFESTKRPGSYYTSIQLPDNTTELKSVFIAKGVKIDDFIKKLAKNNRFYYIGDLELVVSKKNPNVTYFRANTLK